MVHRLPVRRLAGLVMAFVLSAATAQQAGAPQRSFAYEVGGTDAAGLSGTLFLADYGASTTVVVLSLDGTRAGDVHPSHLHAGDCASGGGVEITLADVDGATGLGVTLLATPLDDIVAADYHVNAHRSAREMGTIVACGEVGQGAAAAEGGTTAAQGPAATDGPADAGDDRADAAGDGEAAGDAALAEQQATLRTASYQLFALEGSGVNGTLNVTQDPAGSKLVVTLTGVEEGERYLPVLFEGDCGPDRERIMALPPVGSIPNDPFSSIVNVDMGFDELSEGNHFLYIYRGETEVEPVACGEVGAGANR